LRAGLPRFATLLLGADVAPFADLSAFFAKFSQVSALASPLESPPAAELDVAGQATRTWKWSSCGNAFFG
jgi:hypothetical protein